MRSVKQPATLPVLALTAWLAMPAQAADGEFALSQDFLSAEPSHARDLPGTDLRNIKKMPAQSLRQLMASARGQLPLERKTPLVPLVLNPAAINGEKPQTPLVYVTGPNTKHQLTPVTLPDAMKVRAKEEEEILREAEAALRMDLPDEDLAPRPLPMKKAPTAVATVKIPYALPSADTRPAKAQTYRNKLRLKDVGGELQITPKSLVLSLADEGVAVENDPHLQPQIFVRQDQQNVRWDPEGKQLDALTKGRTELYITYRNQLYIVPIEVKGGIAPKAKGSESHADSLLANLPASFQKLTSVMPLMEQPYARYDDGPSAPADAPREEPQQQKRESLTLSESVARVKDTQKRLAEQQSRFFYTDSTPDYRTLDIHVMDDRSLPEFRDSFQVTGVTVRVLGTNLKATTDAEGHAKFGEIPEGSRFFVEVVDEKHGRIIPTVSEVHVDRNGKSEVQVARTMRYSRYSLYLDLLDIAQDTGKASFCGRVMFPEKSGYTVSLSVKDELGNEVKADGPFYIKDQVWTPDRKLTQTESSGRFCFFNVLSGLAELKFGRANETGYFTALTLPLLPGAHTEEDLDLPRPADAAMSGSAGQFVLAALPSATDQLYEEPTIVEQPLQPIEYVNMTTVGINEYMTLTRDSVLSYGHDVSLFKGRLYSAVFANEFEGTLYTFDRDKRARNSLPVVPLLQRGYVQDLVQELQAPGLDPALGSLVVMHHMENGLGAVNVTLVDSYGHTFTEGWNFGNSSQGISRTLFFNMRPGIYTVVVDDGRGAIQALDTIAIDTAATSVVQTGSTVNYSLQPVKLEQ